MSRQRLLFLIWYRILKYCSSRGALVFIMGPPRAFLERSRSTSEPKTRSLQATDSEGNSRMWQAAAFAPREPLSPWAGAQAGTRASRSRSYPGSCSSKEPGTKEIFANSKNLPADYKNLHSRLKSIWLPKQTPAPCFSFEET